MILNLVKTTFYKVRSYVKTMIRKKKLIAIIPAKKKLRKLSKNDFELSFAMIYAFFGFFLP